MTTCPTVALEGGVEVALGEDGEWDTDLEVARPHGLMSVEEEVACPGVPTTVTRHIQVMDRSRTLPMENPILSEITQRC